MTDNFVVTWYDTKAENKYQADDRHGFMCDRDSAFKLWYKLHKELGFPHVEIRNLRGIIQDPNKGLHGLIGYSI